MAEQADVVEVDRSTMAMTAQLTMGEWSYLGGIDIILIIITRAALGSSELMKVRQEIL